MNVVTSDQDQGSRTTRSRATAPALLVLLAAPRGFCAGVVRAIDAVENALRIHGAPVYVRRAIVHNLTVVRSLEAQGAIFIEELDEAPAGARVILSAHGVGHKVIDQGRRLGLDLVDAVCPLVSKVHREMQRHFADGRHVILIGHAGHPEILGSLGRLPAGAATLVGSPHDIESLDLPADLPLAYAVQTTFSIEEADALITALRARFPDLVGPSSSDICYATTNRQQAVREIAPRVDAMIVAGASISSNANRLVEVARAAGCRSQLVESACAIDWSQLEGVRTLGITSAASTPETIVRGIVDMLAGRFKLRLEEVGTGDERTSFRPVRV